MATYKTYSASTLIPLHELGEFLANESKSDYPTLRAQFARLTEESDEEVKTGNKASLCGTLLGNIAKNRYKQIRPYDRYRVILGRTWDDFQSLQIVEPSMHSTIGNYINASYIGACDVDTNGNVFTHESIAIPRFIVTQDPLEDTIGDFWQMIYEQRVPIIIRLSETLDGEADARSYWAQEVGGRAFYSTNVGDIGVELVHEMRNTMWVARSFKIWCEDDKTLTMFVRHMQYLGWEVNFTPTSRNLLKFMDDIVNPIVPIAVTAGPTVVQSRGGIGRNGFFVAACILKEDIEMGMKGVDIYNIVKQLRKYQLGFVNSVEFYINLHKFALQSYIQSKADGYRRLEFTNLT